MSRSSRIVACAAALTTVASLALATTAAGADQARIARLKVGRARYDWTPQRTASQIAKIKSARAAFNVKTFTTTVQDGTKTFKYTMVGKNPFVAQSTPSTTIKTVLVPLKIKFSNGDNWDPSVVTSCDSKSALVRTQKSPIFVAQNWSAGPSPLGTAQYVDAVQREQFYKFTKAGAINPGYHVKLALTTLATKTVNVPNAAAAEGSTVCGNHKLGAIEINWFDNYVQNTLIPSIPNATSVFPLFLVENVVWYVNTTSNCCVLGYHNAFSLAGKTESYGVSIYDNTGDFSGSGDVSALSHEVSEWINDPNTVNPTKPWGHIGQVSGCQANLETGDPLSGTVITDNLNGKTYHPQELAFFSWFYHQKPSIGANGWYSSGGTFTTPAAKCT